MLLVNRFRRRKAHFVMCKSNSEDLEILAAWANTGKLRSVIEQVYSLDDIAVAHQRIETKRCKGKLVIKIK